MQSQCDRSEPAVVASSRLEKQMQSVQLPSVSKSNEPVTSRTCQSPRKAYGPEPMADAETYGDLVAHAAHVVARWLGRAMPGCRFTALPAFTALRPAFGRN
jgi:hypothetical protein